MEEHEGKLVVKSDTFTIAVEYAVLYFGLYTVMALLNMFVFKKLETKYFLLMFAAIVPLYIYGIISAKSTITLIEADEFRGARAIVELGRKRIEIIGTTADEFVTKQNFFEKKRGTGRLKVSKYRLYLYGVKDIEVVRAYLDKHFQRNEKKTKHR